MGVFEEASLRPLAVCAGVVRDEWLQERRLSTLVSGGAWGPWRFMCEWCKGEVRGETGVRKCHMDSWLPAPVSPDLLLAQFHCARNDLHRPPVGHVGRGVG
jgi:hypothetical protein